MKLKLPITKVTIACLILIAATNITANAQEVITLQKAVERALERNLTIKQAQYNEALSVADYEQSRNNRLPAVSASPRAYYNFGRSADPSTNQFVNQRIFAIDGGVNAQVTLFQGFQLRNQIIQNRILVDVDKSNTAKIKNDLVLNVVTQYLAILTNQDLVTAAKQQIDISKIALDRAQKNFDVGNQTLADLSQAKAQRSTAELNLTTAQNQLDISLLVLKQYMEMNPLEEITVEKPDISKLGDVRTAYDGASVIKTALEINPDVKLAETRERVSQQAIKTAMGAYYPSVVLFGSANSFYSDARTINGANYPFVDQFKDNFNQSVGISLQIPIFNRFTTRTSVRKARINFLNAQVNTQLSKNNLSKIIIQAVLDVQAANKKLQSTEQAYQANKEAFNVIQQRYNVGLVNSLDYNTSLTNLNKSQFDLIQARYEVIFRSKVIDYYLGNPITL
ncbi:TolC family protein [Mucilaginibacter gilvus]|uniref:TolC family protein n=1 Tax=Mucilaginibacter gilvus TaxID=2305909 RepID=A0A3S3Z8H8_9SPHI|nr:TolC family protein [Mucilaginibacter gilvus]RWY55636.1 TolC family protein [Mucilaginibacter gilvus]